jgi:hypothetical protein
MIAMKSNMVGCLSVVFTACIVLLCCALQKENTTFYFASEQIIVERLDEARLGIVYKDASGQDVEIEAGITGADQTLYDEGGVVLVVTPKGEVYYTWPTAWGTQTYAINPHGMAVHHEHNDPENTYTVLFIDQSTGCVEYTAHIVEIGGQWFARFEAPISEDVPVVINEDFYGYSYKFEFDNAEMKGDVAFSIDMDGNIRWTAYLSLR